jgi:hypothetical protein
VEERGNSPFTGLCRFPRALALGFPPDVRTGAGGADTLRTIPGSVGIPGGVGGVSLLVYVGAGVGAEAYR